MTTNATKINIVLVHGIWFDASSWSKVITTSRKSTATHVNEQLVRELHYYDMELFYKYNNP